MAWRYWQHFPPLSTLVCVWVQTWRVINAACKNTEAAVSVLIKEQGDCREEGWMRRGIEMSLLKGPWSPVPQLLVIPADPKLSSQASLCIYIHSGVCRDFWKPQAGAVWISEPWERKCPHPIKKSFKPKNLGTNCRDFINIKIWELQKWSVQFQTHMKTPHWCVTSEDQCKLKDKEWEGTLQGEMLQTVSIRPGSHWEQAGTLGMDARVTTQASLALSSLLHWNPPQNAPHAPTPQQIHFHLSFHFYALPWFSHLVL